MRDQKEDNKVSELLQELRQLAEKYESGRDINPGLVKGTSEWFFSDEALLNWRDSAGAGIFWLTAGLGCGKSVLAKILVKGGHLTRPLTTVDVGAATFTTKSASLLSDDSLTDIRTRPALVEYRKNGRLLMDDADRLWGLLVQCAASMNGRDVICVLDALDECHVAARNQFLYTLDTFYGDKNETSATENLKFFITSRPYDDIERSLCPFIGKI
ncbi:hypothetical protein V2A60_008428 [Cordyceps javanica]